MFEIGDNKTYVRNFYNLKSHFFTKETQKSLLQVLKHEPRNM